VLSISGGNYNVAAVDKKSEVELEVVHKADSQAAPQNSDDTSRDPMTSSSDPERGDGGAASREQDAASSPSTDGKTTESNVDEVPSTMTSAEDGTTSPETNRKENPDQQEAITTVPGMVVSEFYIAVAKQYCHCIVFYRLRCIKVAQYAR